MKVLNSLKKKSKTYKVRAWLLHIKKTCLNNDICELCPYLDKHLDGCKICITIRRFTSKVTFPAIWTIWDEGDINPEEPPNLDFLNHITWSDSGGYPAATKIVDR